MKFSYLFRRICGVPVLAFIILLIALAVTVGTWDIVWHKNKALAETRLQGYQDLLVSHVTHHLDDYAQVLHGAAGLFNSSEKVTQNEWKQYVDSLKLQQYYPGLKVLGYVEPVPQKEKKNNNESLHFASVYEEAVHSESNEKIFIPDDESINIRQEAMDAARDEGKVAISKKLVLVQEPGGEKQLGFLMLFPVYQKGMKLETLEERRSALQGYVYSMFSSKDFLNEATRIFDEYLEVKVYDSAEAASKNLIYKTVNQVEANEIYEGFQASNHLLVGDHVWSVASSPKRTMNSAFYTEHPHEILAMGLIISILLFVLSWMVLAARSRQIKMDSIPIVTDESTLPSERKPFFFAKMFHELRTPLNSILALSKILHDNKDNNLTSKQTEQAGIIHQSGAELLGMIDEALDLSKMASGKMNLKFDKIIIPELAKDIERTFSSMTEKKSLVFQVSVDENLTPIMYSDYKKIYQILKNLCDNAIKFTNQGEISVRFYKPQRMDTLAVSVTDTGTGISKTKMISIFNAFEQGDNLNTEMGGVGLGLAISQEIANLLGGEITVKSEEGKGSCFTVYLPRNTSLKGAQ